MITGQRSCDQPLCILINPRCEDSRSGMTNRDPIEADLFPLEVDPICKGIPLHEPIADPERQTAKFVAPNELGIRPRDQVEHDVWDRLVAKRVLIVKVGPSLKIHLG